MLSKVIHCSSLPVTMTQFSAIWCIHCVSE